MPELLRLRHLHHGLVLESDSDYHPKEGILRAVPFRADSLAVDIDSSSPASTGKTQRRPLCRVVSVWGCQCSSETLSRPRFHPTTGPEGCPWPMVAESSLDRVSDLLVHDSRQVAKGTDL